MNLGALLSLMLFVMALVLWLEASNCVVMGRQKRKSALVFGALASALGGVVSALFLSWWVI